MRSVRVQMITDLEQMITDSYLRSSVNTWKNRQSVLICAKANVNILTA